MLPGTCFQKGTFRTSFLGKRPARFFYSPLTVLSTARAKAWVVHHATSFLHSYDKYFLQRLLKQKQDERILLLRKGATVTQDRAFKGVHEVSRAPIEQSRFLLLYFSRALEAHLIVARHVVESVRTAAHLSLFPGKTGQNATHKQDPSKIAAAPSSETSFLFTSPYRAFPPGRVYKRDTGRAPFLDPTKQINIKETGLRRSLACS